MAGFATTEAMFSCLSEAWYGTTVLAAAKIDRHD